MGHSDKNDMWKIVYGSKSAPQEAWVGIDLDGTLAEYNGWKGIEHIGRPIMPIVYLIQSLVANGIKVRIFTARCQEGPKAIEYITKWCYDYVGLALPVTDKKDFGLIAIIDDRATGVEMNTGRLLTELPDLKAMANKHWAKDNPDSPTYQPDADPQEVII